MSLHTPGPPAKSLALRSQPPAPLALAALAFGSGIWLAGALHRPPWLWALAACGLAACAIAAVAANCMRFGKAPALLALICAGAFCRLWMPAAIVSQPAEEFLYSRQVEIIGHVTHDGSLLAGREARERFDLETESIQAGPLIFRQPVGMRATLFTNEPDEDRQEEGHPNEYGQNEHRQDEHRQDEHRQDEHRASLPPLAYGDRIKFTAKLRLPRNFHNPGAFDYEGYLRGLGIGALASAPADSLEILPGKRGSRLGFWRSAIRRSLLEHIHGQGSRLGDARLGNERLWSEEDAAFFAAMILGDAAPLPHAVREEFQETGVYHLLVVSGMNVGLLAWAVFWLARRLRAPAWAASAATMALSAFYAGIAGFGAPVLRAVFMLWVFLVARLLYRERAALNATGFAALAVLILSPLAWFEASFQLTFLALLSISGISLPVLERTSAPYRQALRHLDSIDYDLSLEPRLAQFRLDLRLIAGRVARFFGTRAAQVLTLGSVRLGLTLYDLALVSSITQASLALPMRAYFHRAALAGLPANLLVLPLAGVLLNAGVAAIALSYVPGPLAHWAGRIAATALHGTLFCIAAVAHWPVARWRAPDQNLAIALIAVAGVVVALAAVRRRKTAALAGLAWLMLGAAVAALYRPAPKVDLGKLEITAIDVGQGDSLLVVSPEGRTMLIDGGGAIGPFRGEFDFGEDVVSPYLWSRGFDHLDVVALTHAHDDHIGGLPRIVENFHPRELWLGANPETPALERLRQIALLNHVQVQRHEAGDLVEWGTTHIRVLSPPPGWRPRLKPRNDDSLTLLLTYGSTSALLAGDLEEKMEKFIAAGAPRADLLKVAHHGSATSTTPELLAAAQPRFAVISAGFHNSFGHPRPAVLQRLQQARVRTYRTDLMGAVTFLLDGATVEPRLARCF